MAKLVSMSRSIRSGPESTTPERARTRAAPGARSAAARRGRGRSRTGRRRGQRASVCRAREQPVHALAHLRQPERERDLAGAADGRDVAADLLVAAVDFRPAARDEGLHDVGRGVEHDKPRAEWREQHDVDGAVDGAGSESLRWSPPARPMVRARSRSGPAARSQGRPVPDLTSLRSRGGAGRSQTTNSANTAISAVHTTHSPKRTYSVSPRIAVTVAFQHASVRRARSRPAPRRSRRSGREMPEIAACTTGPARSPRRASVRSRRAAPSWPSVVGAVVRRHDDHLGAVPHERADLVAERRLEADHGRDLDTRRCRTCPGSSPGAKSRGMRSIARDATLEEAAERDALAVRHEVALRVRALRGRRRVRTAGSGSRARPSGASVTALASTHASCSVASRDELPARARDRCGDPRPCDDSGKMIRSTGSVIASAELEVAAREVAVGLLLGRVRSRFLSLPCRIATRASPVGVGSGRDRDDDAASRRRSRRARPPARSRSPRSRRGAGARGRRAAR